MRILLVELNKFHSECLYSVAKHFKDQGDEVDIIMNQYFKDATKDPLEEVSNKVNYIDCRSAAHAVWKLYGIARGYDAVYFNTLHGSLVLKFFLIPMPFKFKVWGTIHNAKKLKNSIGVRHIITPRADAIYVLAGYVKTYAEKYTNKPIDVIYTTARPKSLQSAKVDKPEGEVWFAVPGGVSSYRRQYEMLLPRDGMRYPENVKILIIGKVAKNDKTEELMKVFSDERIKDNIVLFDRFVTQEEMAGYLEASDYLLPLLSVEADTTRQYYEYKVSGAFNLAIMFGTKMINPVEVKGTDEYFTEERSLFCDMRELPEFIAQLA